MIVNGHYLEYIHNISIFSIIIYYKKQNDIPIYVDFISIRK